VSLGGHLRTIGPRLRHALRPQPEPPSRPWWAEVDDPGWGRVRLSGRLTPPASGTGEGRSAALLVVHGLGGCADSHYVRRTAAAAAAHGVASLRLNLRGSDRRGEDYYHAGLAVDLHTALASPELAGYDDLYALGFSLGGHTALHLAVGDSPPRLRAVAAVCAPLDLAPCAEAIDRPGLRLYRAYLLASLRSIYREVAARHAVPLPLEQARGIRSLVEWDERVVAPRHGFAGAADYYARASVGPRLGDLALPALVVAGRDDPMVPAETLRRRLGDRSGSNGGGAGALLTTRWVAAGGHLGFPEGTDLDVGGDPAAGVEAQLLAWLIAHRST
jgi:hypothetical protein